MQRERARQCRVQRTGRGGGPRMELLNERALSAYEELVFLALCPNLPPVPLTGPSQTTDAGIFVYVCHGRHTVWKFLRKFVFSFGDIDGNMAKASNPWL